MKTTVKKIDEYELIGEVFGIYKIIEPTRGDNNEKLYVVECIECGQRFKKNKKVFSGARTVHSCRHQRKRYDINILDEKYCLYCGELISKINLTPSKYNKRKFCSQECFKKYQGQDNKNYCLYCGTQISAKKKYCNIQCQHEFQYKEYINKWKSGQVSGLIGNEWIELSGYIRRYIFEKYDNKCSICGWSAVNPFTGTLPLEIEHIDGDATNCLEDNLTLLCPNCHSLTKTYRGANKGRGKREIKWLSRAGVK